MSALEATAIANLIEKANDAGVGVLPQVKDALQKVLGSDTAWAAARWHELHPDDDLEFCCWGNTNMGPGGCTCWEAVYDETQDLPDLTSPIEAATDRCGDCAFRKGSPELRDEYMRDTLLTLATKGDPTVAVTRQTIAAGDVTPFWCHTGMRRPVAYEHQPDGKPSGRRLDSNGDDWKPPIVAGVPYRRDGRAGLLCAGWTAQRTKLQARVDAS